LAAARATPEGPTSGLLSQVPAHGAGTRRKCSALSPTESSPSLMPAP
jgi:hypothetical protein